MIEVDWWHDWSRLKKCTNTHDVTAAYDLHEIAVHDLHKTLNGELIWKINELWIISGEQNDDLSMETITLL